MSTDPSWACPVLHVDMDAFYASVLLRERPDLRTSPVIVGGGPRGVVLAANYVARGYGITSAMSGTRARRLCPHVVSLRPDHALFATVSRAVIEIFRQVTPVVETVSLDEAFLDVSGAVRRLGSPRAIGEMLRARVHDEQRITCSVGVAPSISVAKLASTHAKPDGLLVVPPEQVTAFLRPLDVGALWGVGEKTRARLHRRGLRLVGDLADTPVDVAQEVVGSAAGAHLHALARGVDRRTVQTRRAPAFGGAGAGGDGADAGASVGAQRTLARDTDEPAVLLRELLGLTTGVTSRLRVAGLVGRTVVLTVRHADFTTVSRSRTLTEPTDVTVEVFAQVTRLLDALHLGRTRVRLVGVRVEGLRLRAGVQRQLSLDEAERGWAEADRAVDRAARRFGDRAVRPASLLAPAPAARSGARAGVDPGHGAGPRPPGSPERVGRPGPGSPPGGS